MAAAFSSSPPNTVVDGITQDFDDLIQSIKSFEISSSSSFASSYCSSAEASDPKGDLKESDSHESQRKVEMKAGKHNEYNDHIIISTSTQEVKHEVKHQHDMPDPSVGISGPKSKPKPPPRAKPPGMKLMIAPADGSKVRYVHVKMIGVLKRVQWSSPNTGEEKEQEDIEKYFEGSLLTVSYALESRNLDSSCDSPRVVRSKTKENVIGKPIVSRDLNDLRELLAARGLKVKYQLDKRGFELFDWRVDTKNMNEDHASDSIVYEKILMYKKTNCTGPEAGMFEEFKSD